MTPEQKKQMLCLRLDGKTYTDIAREMKVDPQEVYDAMMQHVNWCIINTDYYGLPSRVRRLRRMYGMAQSELGKAVGLSATHISNIEAENYWPSNDKIKQIADYFGLTPYQLTQYPLGGDYI